MHSKKIKYLAVLVTLFSLFSFLNPGTLKAQDLDSLSVGLDAVKEAEKDSLSAAADSFFASSDTLSAASDSLSAASDSLDLLSKSSLSVPAFSAATDSIVEDFTNGQRKIYYYGGVEVKYEDINIKAAYMEYDMTTGTVYACGVYDSLEGVWNGQPVMEQGGTSYNMEEVRYNFNTKKAKIYNMLTSQDGAILHGKNIKMMPDQSFNLTGGRYTVCDLEHPHYYLQLSSAHVQTKPNQKTVFGPACIVVEDVPIYFVGLPYGFIPKTPQRATGLLMPTFGEEEARGFYLRDMGFYLVLGDHFDFSVTGDYYTLGSWSIAVNSRYKVRYKFNGTVAFNYSLDQTGEPGSSDFFQSTNFGIKWSHSQDSKAHPGSSFSASVNFSSPSNSRYNSHSITEAQNNQVSSSVSYSHNWNGKFNLSVNALGSQNSRDSSYSINLPNITFSMSTIYPFKQKHRVGKEKFYEKFSLGYSTSFQNKLNFKASDLKQEGYNPLDNLNNGMNHNFSIGIPSFTLLKYLNFTPSVSYGMNWFFKKTEYVYDEETDAPKAVSSGAFSTFGVTQTVSAGLSANTRLYGMYNFGKQHHIQAIRHVISPSISASWSPNMATSWNGYRTLEYVDSKGQAQTYEYNLYAGQLNSVPGKGQSASCSWAIGNNLEAKVRDQADTTGVGSKKVKLIDNFNISGSYNFLADSMNLSGISMSLSTNLFSKLNISASAGFDPYAVNNSGSKYNKLAVAVGQGLMRLTNFSTSMSCSFSGKGEMKGNVGAGKNEESAADYYKRIYYHPYTNEYIPGGWLYYTNPNVPWSVNLSYNLGWTRKYSTGEDGSLVKGATITQTLSVSGNVKVTPKLHINLSTGFDIQALKLTTTTLSATYDLHCFNISVQWIPTGMYKSYSFCISANASTLADLLKFKKSSSYWDN